MKILIIEPFFTGSHKKWALEYQKFSRHEISILSLPGRFWKWRMHGGAITLSKEYNKIKNKPDLILTTDMLNLPVFQSLVKKTCPIAIYFHENQFTYPWSKTDLDSILQRDKNYAFINYSSVLCADHIFFNSTFHLNSFINGLDQYLNELPDFNEFQNITQIKNKSSVLFLGLNLNKFDQYYILKKNNRPPLILWNHRWEYDKNPESFFKILTNLSKKGVAFKLVILGQQFRTVHPSFIAAKSKLDKHIIHFGYTKSFKNYSQWLWASDLLPITSFQDFFGISIVEATYCKTLPLVPRRLSYPELFQEKKYPNIFYDSDEELEIKLGNFIKNNSKESYNKYNFNMKKYDWLNMVSIYDNKMEEIKSL